MRETLLAALGASSPSVSCALTPELGRDFPARFFGPLLFAVAGDDLFQTVEHGVVRRNREQRCQRADRAV